MDYRSLPAPFRDAFRVFDEDGSGDVDIKEIERAAKRYKDFANKTKGTYKLEFFPDDLQGTVGKFRRINVFK